MDRQPLSAGTTSDAAMVESNEKLGGPKRSKIAPDPGFWAFPSALQKLKGGMGYYSRNFDLDGAIRNAEIP